MLKAIDFVIDPSKSGDVKLLAFGVGVGLVRDDEGLINFLAIDFEL